MLHGEEFGKPSGHLLAGGWALLGAASGFVLLWLISVLGKKAFGKKTLDFAQPEPFTWTLEGERAKLVAGGQEHWWDELFANEKDFLVMNCGRFEFDGTEHLEMEVRFQYERLHLDGKEHDLNKVKLFSGTVSRISFKRDAMGFGDVKFIACIGAFLGWEAVLFTVMSASFLGAIIGGLPLLIGKREWSAKIPFGPYLSLGALLWLFHGPELVAWYLALTAPAPL